MVSQLFLVITKYKLLNASTLFTILIPKALIVKMFFLTEHFIYFKANYNRWRKRKKFTSSALVEACCTM
jgi:hypothetical protein